MESNVIKEKSFQFAVKILKFSESIDDSNYNIISYQLKRSGTSIGAQVREAEHAQSLQDFIHKFSIAQKETNETLYWLELLKAIKNSNIVELEKMLTLANELMLIITSIIRTSKKKSKLSNK
jgi:four helix bundle protein